MIPELCNTSLDLYIMSRQDTRFMNQDILLMKPDLQIMTPVAIFTHPIPGLTCHRRHCCRATAVLSRLFPLRRPPAYLPLRRRRLSFTIT